MSDDEARRLRAFDLAHGHALRGGTLTMRRADWHGAMIEAVGERVALRSGMGVAALAQDRDGGEVVLSDGSGQRDDMVVGADGLHSAVSRLWLGHG